MNDYATGDELAPDRDTIEEAVSKVDGAHVEFRADEYEIFAGGQSFEILWEFEEWTYMKAAA
jgi:hypothetical protein